MENVVNNLDLYGDVIDSPTKFCNKCDQELYLTEFAKESGCKNQLKSYCRKCENKLSYERNLVRKTAPTIDSEHSCPICGQNAEDLSRAIQTTVRKPYSPWALDHDHDTKQFRGWLCRKCNLALGNFNDSIDILKKAIQYLANHKS